LWVARYNASPNPTTDDDGWWGDAAVLP